MVARQLAQEWEAKLQAQQQLQEEYERFCHQRPKQLSLEQQQQIRQLAKSIPKLWSAPTTTQAQRKEIIRQVIDKITVIVEGASEQVQIMIEWSGGCHCQAQIIRPVATWTQLSYYPQLCERLKQLVEANLSTDEMIERLNQEGFRPPKRRQTFNREIVQSLRRQLGFQTRQLPKARDPLAEHEWWLPELAATLEMPSVTLSNWVRRGWVKARQKTTPPKHWIIWADEAELERLRTHRQRPVGAIQKQRWKGEVPTIAIPPE